MNQQPKPVAEACERNKAPLLDVLRDVFSDRREVLEVGSGTGQHAVHFAAGLPHLVWHTCDLAMHHDGIRMWLDDAALPNTRGPYTLDLSQGPWPLSTVDAVFSANVLHIVAWPLVERFFSGVGDVLAPGGVLAVYGPFNYNGAFTSESNGRFNDWLKARDPQSGIRDFEAIDALATRQGLTLQADVTMPANNRMLWWRRAL